VRLHHRDPAAFKRNVPTRKIHGTGKRLEAADGLVAANGEAWPTGAPWTGGLSRRGW